MKHLTWTGFATAVAMVMAPAAYAADMPAKARYAPPPPPPVYNWTGCYVGTGVGWGGHTTLTDRGTAPQPTTTG
jgi:outer membrane immunogenic protein